MPDESVIINKYALKKHQTTEWTKIRKGITWDAMEWTVTLTIIVPTAPLQNNEQSLIVYGILLWYKKLINLFFNGCSILIIIDYFHQITALYRKTSVLKTLINRVKVGNNKIFAPHFTRLFHNADKMLNKLLIIFF